MPNDISLTDKLLSHRLRGFNSIEHTATGLKNTVAYPLPFLEIDTRASSDGEIYVHHDPNFQTASRAVAISKSSSQVLEKLRYPTGEKLLSLNEALSIFNERPHRFQKLCIDIKDYGFEDRHIDLVRTHELENDVIFLSWIPLALVRLRALGNRCPLFLSHWSLFRLGWLGIPLFNLLRNRVFSFGHFVFIGANRSSAPLPSLEHGFQHTIVTQEVPAAVLNVLSASKGGLCVHRSAVNESLARYCRENGLRLWVFGIKTHEQYLKYRRHEEIEVIFSDNALDTLRFASDAQLRKKR